MGNPDLGRQPFSHKGPFTATRPFRLHGKDYAIGDPIDPARVAVDHRKWRQLYDARSINMAGDATTPSAAPAEEPKKTEPADAGLVAGVGEFLFDPEVHAVEKSGKEDWIADEESLLVHITAKAATALKKAKKPTIVTKDEIVEWPEADDKDDGDQGQLDLDDEDEGNGENA